MANWVILNCFARIQGSWQFCFSLTFCHYLPLIPRAGLLCLCSEFAYFIISAYTIIISHTQNDLLTSNHLRPCLSKSSSFPHFSCPLLNNHLALVPYYLVLLSRLWLHMFYPPVSLTVLTTDPVSSFPTVSLTQAVSPNCLLIEQETPHKGQTILRVEEQIT